MGRPPRLHYPGALYHVLSRGNERQPIFRREEEYERFLRFFAQLKESKKFRVYAFCLMPNHFHLLLQIGEIPLSEVMQRLLTSYANAFNSWYQREGHLFQARYKAIHCVTEPYFLELLRYIHLNPVRAGLCDGPAQWKWSGHTELMGLAPRKIIDADFPLSLFASDVDAARALYNEFIGYGSINPNEPIPQPVQGACVKANDKRRAMTIPIDEIVRDIAIRSNLATSDIVSRSLRAVVVAARKHAIITAISEGHRPSAVAAYFGVGQSAISMLLRRLATSEE